MAEITLRKRHRLRKKEIRALSKDFFKLFSKEIDLSKAAVDGAVAGEYEVLILDNEIFAFYIDNTPFLTIRGILKFRPTKWFVTVDMGAVKFISNGADVMAPGIVDADPRISVDDIVWVRDQNHLQPLAVGRAMMIGDEMVQNNKDKAIKTIHYINDKLWNTKI
jgi:PUA domain protein